MHDPLFLSITSPVGAYVRRLALALTLPAVASSATAATTQPARGEPIEVRAPAGDIVITLDLAQAKARDGRLAYRVSYRGKPLLHDSPLGLTLREGGPLGDLEVAGIQRASRDETHPIVAGKAAAARDRFNEAVVVLRERAGGGANRTIEVALRAYDDGVAFRYRFPEQTALAEFAITSEDSGFAPPPGATAWVLPVPNHTSHYEFNYQPKKVSELEPGKLIGLPLLLELPEGGPAVAITEANVTDYAGMYLTAGAPSGDKGDPPRRVLHAALVPAAGPEGHQGEGQGAARVAVAGHPDRRQSRGADRIQPRVQPERALRHRRHVVDQAG